MFYTIYIYCIVLFIICTRNNGQTMTCLVYLSEFIASLDPHYKCTYAGHLRIVSQNIVQHVNSGYLYIWDWNCCTSHRENQISDSCMMIGWYWEYTQDQPIRLLEPEPEIDNKFITSAPGLTEMDLCWLQMVTYPFIWDLGILLQNHENLLQHTLSINQSESLSLSFEQTFITYRHMVCVIYGTQINQGISRTTLNQWTHCSWKECVVIINSD